MSAISNTAITPLRQAEEILRKLDHIESSHSVLDQTTVLIENSMEENLKAHGEKYLELLKHFVKVDAARLVCREIAQNLFPNDPHESEVLIATTKLGVGECQESTMAALMESIAQINLPVAAVFTGDSDSFNNHVFLVLNPDKRVLCKGSNCKEALLRSDPHSVILDPFLKVACTANAIRDNIFSRFVKNHYSILNIDYQDIPIQDNRLSIIENRAQRIANLAQECLEKSGGIINGLSASPKKFIVNERMRAIRELMPEAEWKNPKGSETFWTQGSEAEMKKLVKAIHRRFGVKLKYKARKDDHSKFVIRIDLIHFLGMSAQKQAPLPDEKV